MSFQSMAIYHPVDPGRETLRARSRSAVTLKSVVLGHGGSATPYHADPRSGGLLSCEGSVAPRHHHDPDDSFVVKRQAHCKVALIRHLASFTPASGLMRPGNDVALKFFELGLRLFQNELLISARLLKHLPAGCDATKGAARRHSFDIGIK
jgi:hypothetical protein